MANQLNCSICDVNGGHLSRALRSVLPGSQTEGVAVRHVRRDEMVYEVGTPPGLIGILRKGCLRRERLTQDGRRTVLGLLLPGSVVGEMPGRIAGYSLESATEAEICLFHQTRARRLAMEDAEFRRDVSADIQRQYNHELTIAWLRCGLRCRERVIAFLGAMADLLPTEAEPDGSVIVTIPVARRDWADLCNTTVESISRQIADLVSEGLIDALGERRYRLRNVPALRAMASLERAWPSTTHASDVAAPGRTVLRRDSDRASHPEPVAQYG